MKGNGCSTTPRPAQDDRLSWIPRQSLQRAIRPRYGNSDLSSLRKSEILSILSSKLLSAVTATSPNPYAAPVFQHSASPVHLLAYKHNAVNAELNPSISVYVKTGNEINMNDSLQIWPAQPDHLRQTRTDAPVLPVQAGYLCLLQPPATYQTNLILFCISACGLASCSASGVLSTKSSAIWKA